MFSSRGVFFDSGFLANHHQIAASAQLDYLAGLLVTAAFTLILGGALVALGRRWPKGVVAVTSCVTVGLVFHALNVVRVWYLPWASFAELRAIADGSVGFWLALVLVLVLVGLVLHRVLGALTSLIMLGLPMGLVVLFNLVGAMVVLGGNGTGLPALALAGVAGGSPVARVAWIIFDEADYRLLFETPPRGLALPAFTSLRDQGLDASGAVSPAGGTLPSIPALISGQHMEAANFTSAGPMAHPRGELVALPWRELSSIFRVVRQKGLNAAALGQAFIPYCRSFHDLLAACAEMGAPWRVAGQGALAHMGGFLARVAAYIPVLNRHLRPELFDSGMAHRDFLGQVTAALADPRLALIYAHWNLPHAPYVYDRRRRVFIPPTEAPARYFDNAALADRMLGDMLKGLEDAGLAAKTTVIVSSDHHWRRSRAQYDGITDHRVPFMVRLAGDQNGLVYPNPFDTIVTKGLVLAILDGRVGTNREAAAFIQRHGVAPRRARPGERNP